MGKQRCYVHLHPTLYPEWISAATGTFLLFPNPQHGMGEIEGKKYESAKSRRIVYSNEHSTRIQTSLENDGEETSDLLQIIVRG